MWGGGAERADFSHWGPRMGADGGPDLGGGDGAALLDAAWTRLAARRRRRRLQHTRLLPVHLRAEK